MRRGEVWWVNFDPALGGEIQKKRPAVIVSNDVSNAALNRVQVVPLTSKTGRLYPSEALITLHGKQSKAMTDQIRTATKERLLSLCGKLSSEEMHALEQALHIQLGLKL